VTGARRIYRLLRGDDSEVRRAAGDFQQQYEALTPAEQAELQRLIAAVEPMRDGRRALGVNDLPALVEEAKRRANPPAPGPADHPYGTPDQPSAGLWSGVPPYQQRSPRSRRPSLLHRLAGVLIVVGFAVIFGSVIWSETAHRVVATNQSCTPSPPRCVVSWEQDGEHHTDQVGPSHVRDDHRNLSPGGVNSLRVRNGHVLGFPWRRAITGGVLVMAGGALQDNIRRRRR
jgi:hypothetical protein